MTGPTRHDTPIRSVMQTSIASTEPSAKLREAARELRDAEVGTLAIMDGPEVSGVVSERDLVRAIASGADPDRVSVGEVMTRGPRYVTLADTAGVALEVMLTAGVRHLPVVDEGELIGIVSIRDVARGLLG